MHLFQIECISVSLGCKYIFTGSKDKRLIAWRAEDGQKLAVFYADSQIKEINVTSDVSTVVALYDMHKTKLAMLKLMYM